MGHEPEEIVLLGVQPQSTELGTALSVPARQALPTLIEAALSELSRWFRSDECSGWTVRRAVEEGAELASP
jgi:Ni,Fe-hydrogenase maturation factor